jgi:hypothetical protein
MGIFDKKKKPSDDKTIKSSPTDDKKRLGTEEAALAEKDGLRNEDNG